VKLTEEQQLLLALMLVILVAVSLLYCLGFASLAVREVWEQAPIPWTETDSLDGILDTPSSLPAATSTLPVATP
jgi:hypothetical protein